MKLNVKRTLLVGISFMTISAFWQLYDFAIPLMLYQKFHMPNTFSGIAMSLDNVLALVMLPFSVHFLIERQQKLENVCLLLL